MSIGLRYRYVATDRSVGVALHALGEPVDVVSNLGNVEACLFDYAAHRNRRSLCSVDKDVSVDLVPCPGI